MADKKPWYEVECSSREEGKFFSSIKNELKKYSEREHFYNACIKGHKSKSMRVLRSLMIPEVKSSFSFEEYQSHIRTLVEHGSKDVVRAIMVDDTSPQILMHNDRKVEVQNFKSLKEAKMISNNDPTPKSAGIECENSQSQVEKPTPSANSIELIKEILKNQHELSNRVNEMIRQNTKVVYGENIDVKTAMMLAMMNQNGGAGGIDPMMLMLMMGSKGGDMNSMLPFLMMQSGKPCVKKSKTIMIEYMLSEDSIKNMDKFVALFDRDNIDTCVSDLERFIKAYKDFKTSKNSKKSMFSGIIKIQNWFNSKSYKYELL